MRQDLAGHSDALALPAADPADEDGVGPPEAVGVLLLLADGLEVLAVGLAGLLLEELVDRLLLDGVGGWPRQYVSSATRPMVIVVVGRKDGAGRAPAR